MRVKIVGAGSVGNHLAQASRRMGWEVVVVDRDSQALSRMRDEIYPKRYGAWDPNIQLFTSDQEPRGGFDIIFLGTPPSVRMRLAIEALRERPKILQLEKPLCPPTADSGLDDFLNAYYAQKDTVAVVGYDHVVSDSVGFVVGLLEKRIIDEVTTIDIEWGADFQAILLAHPWLKGISDTYLGFWKLGGGASGEHSHALHLWRHLAQKSGLGKWEKVSAFMDMKQEGEAEYDLLSAFLFITDLGKIGSVVQDMVAFPQRSRARIQGQKGFIHWSCNGHPTGDLVRYRMGQSEVVEKIFPKKRTDDFYKEMLHLADILSGKIQSVDSPLSLESGVDVVRVLEVAHRYRNQASVIDSHD